MSIIDYTPREQRPPVEGILLPMPTWAETSRVSDDMEGAVFEHEWTCPDPSEAFVGGERTSRVLQWSAVRRDKVEMTGYGLQHMIGPVQIVCNSLDVGFDDIGEARDFAAALLACCDQAESVDRSS